MLRNFQAVINFKDKKMINRITQIANVNELYPSQAKHQINNAKATKQKRRKHVDMKMRRRVTWLTLVRKYSVGGWLAWLSLIPVARPSPNLSISHIHFLTLTQLHPKCTIFHRERERERGG
jgi:hypothetical protein